MKMVTSFILAYCLILMKENNFFYVFQPLERIQKPKLKLVPTVYYSLVAQLYRQVNVQKYT